MHDSAPTLVLALVLSLLMACGAVDPDAPARDAGATSTESDGGTIVNEDSRVAQYIRSSQYSRLVLEIDSVPGFEPRAAAENAVLAKLAEVLDKPDGIEALPDGALVSQGKDHAWTDAELFALADETFDLAVPDSTIKMHILFVDGHSARDTDSGVILGLAWSNTHLVMFKQTIERVCSSFFTPGPLRESLCENAEFSIWLHEIGHVIGLVNTGLEMVTDHQDEEHGAHDSSDECVMYWAYEGDAVVNQLRDRLIGGNEERLGFDEHCLADIAAMREAP